MHIDRYFVTLSELTTFEFEDVLTGVIAEFAVWSFYDHEMCDYCLVTDLKEPLLQNGQPYFSILEFGIDEDGGSWFADLDDDDEDYEAIRSKLIEHMLDEYADVFGTIKLIDNGTTVCADLCKVMNVTVDGKTERVYFSRHGEISWVSRLQPDSTHIPVPKDSHVYCQAIFVANAPEEESALQAHDIDVN